MNRKKFLVFGAHPDDCDLLFGGTAVKLARAGHLVKFVSACNGDGYNMTTGEPGGVFIMGGNVKKDWDKKSNPVFLAILNDGTAVIDNTQEAWDACKAQGISEAIDIFGSNLVWDGKDVTANASGSYNTDRHSRTMVGITADGKLVICVLDGRQEPFSCGGTMHELAQIMLEAGCVRAFNLDGGGSTTFMAKNEGSNECVIQNRPSDGSERSISNGIIIASTAAPSDIFERATLTADNDYITVNATTEISAIGISPAGTAAEIPAEAVIQVEDPSFGSVENGVFTPAKTGDAVIQMVYGGNVVGQTTVHVVVPEKVAFTTTALAAPYGKSAEIGLSMMYGEFDYSVKYTAEDVTFTLSDDRFGSVDGLTFNATSDTTVTGSGTITANVTGTDLSATIPLNVGKGSEVLFDFEDGSVDGWGWFDYYNANVSTEISAVDANSGKVHSGNYSMAYSIDFSQITYYEDYITSMMTYNADLMKAHGLTTDPDGVKMYGNMEDYVDITGATGLGFWVYLPEEIDISGLNPRFVFGYKKTASSAWTRGSTAMNEFLVNRDGMGSDGWYYFYADLSAFSSYYAMTMQNNRLTNTSSKNGYSSERYYGAMVEWYVEDRAWKNNNTKSYNGKFTLYIDDITVDYSSVVPDREAPIFGDVSYATAGMSDSATLINNATISQNVVDFAVSVAENTEKSNATGISASTAKAYVDGNAVDATYVNGKITIDSSIDFADGVHTVKFEIADNEGNASHTTRTFSISSGSSSNTIKIVPHDTTLTSTLVGSLYYIDVLATDISAVDNVTVSLKVNNVNDWEPSGIIAADGFTVTYTQDVCDAGLITLNATRVADSTVSGEGVIVSIPVRAWYPHNVLEKDSNWIITVKKCVYPMDIQLLTKSGSVFFTDGTWGTFSAEKIQIDSEAMCAEGYIGVNKGNEGGVLTVTSWHEHTETVLADKAATCTEAGYTGRTYCEVCNSVVDWGTTVPATGHKYGQVVDGHFVCSVCNEVCKLGTGLFEIEGKVYYSVNDKLMQGWREVQENNYYFGDDYYALTGVRQIGGENYEYTFDDNGVLVKGAWVKTADSVCYYWAGRRVHRTFFDIDRKTYYFDYQGNMVTGLRHIETGSNSGEAIWYLFDETGAQIKSEGLVKVYDETYYVSDGLPIAAGLVKDENGNYYYIRSSLTAAKSCEYYITKTNGLLDHGIYTFDENGIIVFNETKNGIVNENGTLYYYVDGVKQTNLGMIEIEVNGETKYIYIRSAGQLAVGAYYIYNGNGIVNNWTTQHFDENGYWLKNN